MINDDQTTTDLDADALRAVTGMELGSFALAAERPGVQRRRSALSLKSLSSRAARRWYKGRASSGVDGGRGDYAELRAANA